MDRRTSGAAAGLAVVAVVLGFSEARVAPPATQSDGDREIRVLSSPPHGLRTYGKGAVRLESWTAPAVRDDASETQETPPDALGVDVTNKISGTPMAGSVTSFAVSPNGLVAVYIADQETVGRLELYSTPLDGSATPTKISNGLVFGAGDVGVSGFQISPDSTKVVFLADPSAGGGADDIYSVPIDGSSAPVLLNAAAARPVTAFGISANSALTAFFGTDSSFGSGVTELYKASIGVASSARQVSDVGQGNALGAVVSADFSPDSARLIYAADASANDLFQWYGVATTATGPGTDVQLSAALGSVGVAAISPNSTRVVYASDDLTFGVLAVFSKPIAGGTRVQLNPAMAGGGATGIAISPNSARAVYLADQNTAGVTEVYSALIATASSGTRLNTPMSGTQSADTINVSPDSTRVLYEADQNTVGNYELFGVPIDASAGPSTLHGVTAPADAGFFAGLGTPVIGRRAVYPVVGTGVDVFSVPFDGSAPFVRVNAVPTSGNALLNAFLPASSRTLMAYGVGPSAGTVTRQVYSAPIVANLSPEQINVTAATGALGVLAYEISSSENHGVYLQDQDTLGKPELFSKQLDSDADGAINATDNCRFVANPSQGAVVFGPTVLASGKTSFSFGTSVDVRFVRGPLNLVSVMGTNASGTLLDVVSYTDATIPAAGSGLYYLFAPDCPARSYQTSPGAQPWRDTAGFP